MELDEETIRQIERFTGKNVRIHDQVDSLRDVAPSALEVVAQLAVMWGGAIPAVKLLRHLSKCTLAEAMYFLNNVQKANGKLPPEVDSSRTM